jgi:hypothetical protein
MFESDLNEPIVFEIVKLRACAQCRGPVIYCGFDVPDDCIWSYCSDECQMIYRRNEGGIWVDASELAPGGTLYDRPDLWSD